MRTAIDEKDVPHGFVLSDAALYAFRCQEVYPDLLSFAAAIPLHLRSLFLIPIRLETASYKSAAMKVASRRYGDGTCPSGNTEEADLFGTKTFVYDDQSPTIPNSEPGSIFHVDDADDITHHQEMNFDWNLQDPTDTSYMNDVDVTQYQRYPYRTEEKPVRHSSSPPVVRLSIKQEFLEGHVPEKIRGNASSCNVGLVSYDKRSRTFTFAVDSGNGPRTVRASLSDLDEVTMSCSCPFWRWNGPEFNSKQNRFLLGSPRGTADSPDVRDPNREYWLCKHAYAALKRLDSFVQQVVDENWGADDEELAQKIDENWDKMEDVVEVPVNAPSDDPEVSVDWDDDGVGDEEVDPHPGSQDGLDVMQGDQEQPGAQQEPQEPDFEQVEEGESQEGDEPDEQDSDPDADQESVE